MNEFLTNVYEVQENDNENNDIVSGAATNDTTRSNRRWFGASCVRNVCFGNFQACFVNVSNGNNNTEE